MNRRHMKGIYVVEFAVIGALLFVLLLGVLEFGRLYFTVNTLNEVARRGVRLAVVCDPTWYLEKDKILQRAIFNSAAAEVGSSSLIPDLEVSNIKLAYLDESGEDVADPDSLIAKERFHDIRFVRVSVVNYSYNQVFLSAISGLLKLIGKLFGFESKFNGDINLPTFQATLPRESLGRHSESKHPYKNSPPGTTPCF